MVRGSMSSNMRGVGNCKGSMFVKIIGNVIGRGAGYSGRTTYLLGVLVNWCGMARDSRKVDVRAAYKAMSR